MVPVSGRRVGPFPGPLGATRVAGNLVELLGPYRAKPANRSVPVTCSRLVVA